MRCKSGFERVTFKASNGCPVCKCRHLCEVGYQRRIYHFTGKFSFASCSRHNCLCLYNCYIFYDSSSIYVFSSSLTLSNAHIELQNNKFILKLYFLLHNLCTLFAPTYVSVCSNECCLQDKKCPRGTKCVLETVKPMLPWARKRVTSVCKGWCHCALYIASERTNSVKLPFLSTLLFSRLLSHTYSYTTRVYARCHHVVQQ